MPHIAPTSAFECRMSGYSDIFVMQLSCFYHNYNVVSRMSRNVDNLAIYIHMTNEMIIITLFNYKSCTIYKCSIH